MTMRDFDDEEYDDLTLCDRCSCEFPADEAYDVDGRVLCPYCMEQVV